MQPLQQLGQALAAARRPGRDGAPPARVQQPQDDVADDEPAALPAVLGEGGLGQVQVQVGAPALHLERPAEQPLDAVVGGRRGHQHRVLEVAVAAAGHRLDRHADVLAHPCRQVGVGPGVHGAVRRRDERLGLDVGTRVVGRPAQQAGHVAGRDDVTVAQRPAVDEGVRAVAGQAAAVGVHGVDGRAAAERLDRPDRQREHPARDHAGSVPVSGARRA